MWLLQHLKYVCGSQSVSLGSAAPYYLHNIEGITQSPLVLNLWLTTPLEVKEPFHRG